MTDEKKNIWIFPVIVGFIAIVTLFTPVASLNYMGVEVAHLWIWDLYIYDFGGVLVGSEFISEPLVMIPSLIATSLIAIGGVASLVSGLFLKKKGNNRKIIIPSTLIGILFIAGELFWFMLVPANFPIESYLGPPPPGGTLDLWSLNYMGTRVTLHTMGFGLIGGFLDGVLAFGCVIAAIYYSKK